MALKGEVTIELTNKITGRKRTIKGNNMVTNAYSKLPSMLATIALVKQLDYGYIPLSTTPAVGLLGGILLYGDNLTEDVNNTLITSDKKIIGKAGQYNSQEANKGSYNTLESGATSTGYRHVWDFGTSQCNGTIKALSLTHPYASDDTAHQVRVFTASYADRAYDIPLYFNETTGDLYCYEVENVGGTYTFTLYKVNIVYTPLKVGEKFFDLKSLKSQATQIATASTTSQYRTQSWDAVTGKSYIYTYGTQIVEFDPSNESFTTINLASLPVAKNTGDYPFAIVYGGYIYYYANSDHHIIKVNISDMTDYHEFTDLIGTYRSTLLLSATDGVLFKEGSQYYRIMLDDTYVPSSLDVNDSCTVLSPYLITAGGEYRVFYLNFKHRMTIFNLPSAVTKTATDTMKIIYTLTDAT